MNKSHDLSVTALFEGIKNCAFVNDQTLLMVDENDLLIFYNFISKTNSDTRINLLDSLGKNYTHLDGKIIQNKGKTFYLSYASPKIQDADSAVTRTQLISLFEVKNCEDIVKIEVMTIFRKVVDEDDGIVCYDGNYKFSIGLPVSFEQLKNKNSLLSSTTSTKVIVLNLLEEKTSIVDKFNLQSKF